MNKILYSLAQNKYWITFADQKVEVDMGLKRPIFKRKNNWATTFLMLIQQYDFNFIIWFYTKLVLILFNIYTEINSFAVQISTPFIRNKKLKSMLLC